MNATTNTTTATLNEVKNPQTSATAKADSKPVRVLETREDWAVVFDHTATLLALVAKGEALPEYPAEGFCFGKSQHTKVGTTDTKVTNKVSHSQAPHKRDYLCSLLAAFSSNKGRKHSKGTALADLNLEEVAETVYMAIYPKGNFAQKVGKAEPKQAKSLIVSVLAKM